jgi:acetyl esterase
MTQAMQVSLPPAYAETMPDIREEVYKTLGDVTLKMWIFMPPGHQVEDRRPAMVFFHGGGWLRGHPSSFYKHCEYLAARGMVAITVAYRIREVHHSTVNLSVADARSAMRWIRTHAERWGLDPNRLAAGGSSAGGHLAAATATLNAYDDPGDDLSIDVRPHALVLFNPALVLASIEGKLELASWADHLNKALEMDFELLMGGPPESLSPYHHIPADIGPTLIFHGTADDVVPYFTAELFWEKMKALDRRCELIGYEGAGHGFASYRLDDNAAFVDAVHKMDRFLVSLGYLKEVPENIRHT